MPISELAPIRAGGLAGLTPEARAQIFHVRKAGTVCDVGKRQVSLDEQLFDALHAYHGDRVEDRSSQLIAE